MVSFSLSGAASADQFDDQIDAARQQANAAQAQANQFHAQANDARAKLNQLNAQINQLQSQINLNVAESNKLTAQISDAEAKMAQQKSVLSENIKAIYLASGVTPLEMLASSNNLSTFFNQQQYQDKVKEKIQSALVTIEALKKSLQEQQASLAKSLAEQQTQKQGLAIAQSEAAQLAATYASNAAAADAQVQAANNQVSSLRSAQAAMWARIQAGSSGNHGSVGAFTYKNWTGNMGACRVNLIYCGNEQDTVIDPWKLWNRECVSYAAWAMTQRGATVPSFNGAGNATQWPNTLSGRFPINNSPNGAAVVVIAPDYMIGGVGHAMVVEQVYGDGWIHVSQYNWGMSGQYSEMDVKVVSGLQFIHFR